MRKKDFGVIAFVAFIMLNGCDIRNTDQEYIEVIGEAETQTPEAGYRLNLSYNGPLDLRSHFAEWIDSLQQRVPSMVKMNDNIYVNYMPEQMGKNINKDMFQTSVSYNLIVSDSSMYNRITKDLLKRNLPFNVNVSGTVFEPEKKVALQNELLQQALNNAKAKLANLTQDGRKYEVVGIEELDSKQPFGPEYYDYNRVMIERVKVKAKIL